MEKTLESQLQQILEIKKLEDCPPKNEEQPFAEKYAARNNYNQKLKELEEKDQWNDETHFIKALLLASVARTHFDTDENHDAGVKCKQSLKEFSLIKDAGLLFRGVNWVCLMLNYLGFHAVFGERFYEGILLLDSAEKIYWAVKGSVRRNPQEDWQDEVLRKEVNKMFLCGGEIREQSKLAIGEFMRTKVLTKLLEHAQTVREWSNNPENTKGSSELIQESRNLIPKFEQPEFANETITQLTNDPLKFSIEQCEENYIQSVFFQAQVYGKLMEKDLSAEYCGITLQRQYFKFLKMKNEESLNKKTESNNDVPQIVHDFDYKDFINNSMGLSMYYSEKLMYQQSSRLLELADEVLGPEHPKETEETTLSRASLVHMKANILRDFFMFMCLTLKEQGSARQESKT
jgi:hypothetical protein